MSESKTARASAVKDTKEKKVIPDPELIRLLRIDRASGLYPGTQGTDALLRAYDAVLVDKNALIEQVASLKEKARGYITENHSLKDQLEQTVAVGDVTPEQNNASS